MWFEHSDLYGLELLKGKFDEEEKKQWKKKIYRWSQVDKFMLFYSPYKRMKKKKQKTKAEEGEEEESCE